MSSLAATQGLIPALGAARPEDPHSVYGVLDILPDIVLLNDESKVVRLSDHMRGKALVLLFCPDPRLPACRGLLDAFAARFADIEPHVHLFGVTETSHEVNAAALAEARLPFWLLADDRRLVARGLQVTHNLAAPGVGDGQGAFTVLIADANRKVLRIERNVTDARSVDSLVAYLQNLPAPAPRQLGHFAPILYIPRVLEPEFCRQLIEVYETRGNQESRVAQTSGGLGEGGYVTDRESKVRRDHYVNDPALSREIIGRLLKRVAPEVHKAFTRHITGAEEFKIVCYEAAEGGHFRAHRDNVLKAHAHRRFAMTLNLNAGEYEGGFLTFPEYGPDLYRPDTGDAVIFSCSLLHEATPVTAGRRFVLLAFLFDEEARALNPKYRRPG